MRKKYRLFFCVEEMHFSEKFCSTQFSFFCQSEYPKKKNLYSRCFFAKCGAIISAKCSWGAKKMIKVTPLKCLCHKKPIYKIQNCSKLIYKKTKLQKDQVTKRPSYKKTKLQINKLQKISYKKEKAAIVT